MKFQRLALIGCGLMGGSFALALRQAAGVAHVAGFSASESTRQKALKLGVIDSACASAAEAVQGADLVGSTKGDVVSAARAALVQHLSHFVPAHPIAGKEVAGIEHVDAKLYRDRQLILTPLPENPSERVLRARQVWQALGSRVLELSPEAHDASFAAVSHMPHLLSFALVAQIASEADGARKLGFAGAGFRDFTRIAASSPTMWRDIALANGAALSAELASYRALLDRLQQAVDSGDGAELGRVFTLASDARRSVRLGPAQGERDE